VPEDWDALSKNAGAGGGLKMLIRGVEKRSWVMIYGGQEQGLGGPPGCRGSKVALETAVQRMTGEIETKALLEGQTNEDLRILGMKNQVLIRLPNDRQVVAQDGWE
jgi:hypothetical protein